MVSPIISVVVPVKNGDTWLERFFRGWKSQTLFHQTEIIIIDSGSTDRSIEICKQQEARVYTIEPESFNHGLTRNLGCGYSRGKYILMTVQDAVPQNEFFLEQLVKCLENSSVAAVCGMQIVPELPQTSPFQWHRPLDPPEIHCYQYDQPGLFDTLTPAQKKQVCSWDDVCAMYKKEALEEVPFRKVSFGEDMAWCVDALRKGFRICYQPAAKVFHYHINEEQYLYKRTLTELYAYHDFFGYIPVHQNHLTLYLKSIKLILQEKKLSLKQKWFWLRKEIQDIEVTQKATRHFLLYLAKGDEALYRFYSDICSLPPQAPKG